MLEPEIGMHIGGAIEGPVQVVGAGTAHNNNNLMGALGAHGITVTNAPHSLCVAFGHGNERGYVEHKAGAQSFTPAPQRAFNA